MHDQNGNFSRGPETVRINGNARGKKQTTPMTGMKKCLWWVHQQIWHKWKNESVKLKIGQQTEITQHKTQKKYMGDMVDTKTRHLRIGVNIKWYSI